ncbi:MAG: BlaI/MecI/CopY family transcriptional regulator [Bacteroidales bacterium]|nr:BlaI/MecI/CopY family transcriptional regulator [Bacteroidales bacterium]
MKRLSYAEEQLMSYVWKLDKSFLNELILCYPDPKPAKTTTATLLKRLQEKSYVGFETFGNSRQYYALIEKSIYFSNLFKELISTHFENSNQEFISFLTSVLKLDRNDLDELKKKIDKEVSAKMNKDAVFF